MNLAIELNEAEQKLVSRIDFNPSGTSYSRDSWQPVADAMAELMQSLVQRGAIPEPRKRFFTDPEYNIAGHGLSRQQVFEKNGTRGTAIFRHGNFVKYLRYFLFGPDLPKAVIDAFQAKVADCGEPFTSGDGLDVANYSRQLTRTHGLAGPKVAEEFYKLALDCSLDADDARTVRDTVRKASGLSRSNYYYGYDVSFMCPSLLNRFCYQNNSAPT